VVGGLTYARALGATTVALFCNRDTAIAHMADISILPVVGPDVLTGSTRLKSGTTQKLVLNMLSTASMIRSGKCYQNLMVDLKLPLSIRMDFPETEEEFSGRFTASSLPKQLLLSARPMRREEDCPSA
jgi:fructoselysine-6-P-deglycase FrlB-like protein